ncbi:MAG: NlpC/P60 family protein [Nocardioidaceae bacterium]
MSHDGPITPERRRRTVSRAVRLGGVSGIAVALCLSSLSQASANPKPYPSKQQVQHAKQAVTDKATQVGQIKAALAAADQQRNDLIIKSDQAVEAYDGARYRLGLARQDAKQAKERANAASRKAERQRARVAQLTVNTYQAGGGMSQLTTLLQGQGPQQLLDQLGSFSSTTTAMQGDLAGYQSTKAVADVLRKQADAAVARRNAAVKAAAAAKQQVEAALAASQAAVDRIAAERSSLIRQLAQAQHISVRMAQQRQTALARIARLRAERIAARQAALARARQLREQRREHRQQVRELRREHRQQQHQASTGPTGPTNPPTGPTNPPTNPGGTTPPPPSSGGAAAAIAFAQAQIGKPYVWGAAGPDSWDCSGLTMGSWAAAGVYLPHYAASQYESTTPISSTDLQPGDLVFWGTSSDPASIYHEALYVGGGMIIEAPRTGENVQEVSMYSWIVPNFYSRV